MGRSRRQELEAANRPHCICASEAEGGMWKCLVYVLLFSQPGAPAYMQGWFSSSSEPDLGSFSQGCPSSRESTLITTDSMGERTVVCCTSFAGGCVLLSQDQIGLLVRVAVFCACTSDSSYVFQDGNGTGMLYDWVPHLAAKLSFLAFLL